MKKELIFLGAPASGKGTQTKILAENLNIPHVDTGGMLRAAVAEGTELGKTAKQFMEEGKLVPAEIVIGIVRERLMKPDCDNGFILDGFPRNIEQAEALDKILVKINDIKSGKVSVINIDTAEDLLIDRIVNRRSCSNCGAIYNLKFFPPKNENVCDKCSGTLVQRKDDTEETALNRLNTYKNETAPLIDFYSQKGILCNIDGNGTVDEISKEIASEVNSND